MVPLATVPPLLLSTDQITPEFEGSLKTVLVNCTVCKVDIVTAARLGETKTVSVPGTTVMVAVPFFVVSVTEVAIKVTVAGLGVLTGPLYVTEVAVTFVSVPQALPLQPAPDKDQVAPLFWKSFWTVAVKFCEPPPAPTDAVVGDTETDIGGGGAPLADLNAARAAPHGSEML